MAAKHHRRPGPGIALSIALAALPLALAACQQNPQSNLDTLDKELADKNNSAGARDPALANALQDDIMVDPQLAGQGNQDAVRPPARPYAAPVPPESTTPGARAAVDDARLKRAPAADAKAGCKDCKAADGAMTLGALAQRQRNQHTAGCARDVQYSTGWANRLPADVPLYPDARVSEAAGNSVKGCDLRVVSFTTGASLQTVIDWYYTRLTGAGFSAEHQADGKQHVLGGTRAKDDGAYIIYLSAHQGGGTDVDLVAKNGR